MKKIILILASIMCCVLYMNAQDTMYIMQGGVATNQYNINTEVDSIIFYNPTVAPPPNSKTYMTGKIANAVYIGRWDNSGATYDEGYWHDSAIKVNFTGNTAALGIKQWVEIAFAYRIDGGELQYAQLGYIGDTQYNLTPTPLAGGLEIEHTLEVFNGNGPTGGMPTQILAVDKLILQTGGETRVPTTVRPYHIDYIGDSITAGFILPKQNFDNYTWLIAEALNTEVTNVSVSGATMQTMAEKYKNTNNGSKIWDFNNYQPDMICINLGENGTFSQAEFYDFLFFLRSKNPDAWIVPLGHFRTSTADGLRDKMAGAVAQMNDAKIQVIDGADSALNQEAGGIHYYDSNHPNVEGNILLANYLAPRIAAILGIN